MLNFYKIVKENLSFNRFEFRETVCLEYSCPIDAEQVGIFSCNDYLVYVLSGKKTYKTLKGAWTLQQGQSLYLKKGAEIVQQYFDEEYCMLGFFLSDELIKETYEELKGKVSLDRSRNHLEEVGFEVEHSPYLEGYYHSMLSYFRGINRPPDHMLVLKLKELLVNLMNCDPVLTAYFDEIANSEKPSLHQVMEQNFCFNLKLEDYAELCHRSLSTFKRDFQKCYQESPGKWLQKKAGATCGPSDHPIRSEHLPDRLRIWI